MDFTAEQIQEALKDDRKFEKVYNQFFDGQVQGWLIKKGMYDETERADFVSDLAAALLSIMGRYVSPKIKFKTYVWTAFSQMLCSHYKRRAIVKARTLSLESVTFDFGYMRDDEDIRIDIKMVESSLDGNTKQVFDAMVIGLERKDMSIIGLKEKSWDVERARLKKVLAEVGYGKEESSN